MSTVRQWSTQAYPFTDQEAEEARAMLARVLAFEASVTQPDPVVQKRIRDLEHLVLALRAELRAARWQLLESGMSRG